MALPDYFTLEFGTAIVFGESGGSGVTNAMALDALGAGLGRMGPSIDLGAAWHGLLLVQVRVETGTAPTAGDVVDVYLAWSADNSNWPGKVTGSDAAYPTTVADNARQLGAPVVSLVATGDANTVLQQNGVWMPAMARYFAPVIINNMAQAFRDEATASNNDSRIIVTPVRRLIQDSA